VLPSRANRDSGFRLADDQATSEEGLQVVVGTNHTREQDIGEIGRVAPRGNQLALDSAV
jgi:hypothetical protein